MVLRSTEQTADGHWAIDEPELRFVAPQDAERYLLREGDLLVTKSSGSALHIGKTTIVDTAVANLGAVYSNFMQRVRLSGNESPKYFWYVLRTSWIREQWVLKSTSTTGLANINADSIGQLLVPHPPLDQQRQIAEYLDRETGKIDELITKQEQLVATLTERRQAEIYFAVTKGLDVQVSRKSSGVPWAGNIPNHWTVPRVAHGFVTLLGKMVNEGRAESGTAIEAPYLRAGNVQPYGLDITEVKRMPFSEAELRSLAILRGDLIVVEGGQGGYGRSAIAESDLRGWAFQNHVMRVRPTGMDRNRFLDYILKAMRASGFIASLSSHASLPSFSADKLKSTRYPRPPVNEQDKIVDYLDSTTVRIDQIVAKSAETIALLRERRAALISAAVTGKIDVRGL